MATQASPFFLHLAHSSAAEMATPKNGRSKKLLVRERALVHAARCPLSMTPVDTASTQRASTRCERHGNQRKRLAHTWGSDLHQKYHSDTSAKGASPLPVRDADVRPS